MGSAGTAFATGPWTGYGLRPLTLREFRQFQALIYEEAGIYLSDVKQALLVGRLSRHIHDLGLQSFGEYYRRIVDDGDSAERVELINSICTHETRFFREPRQFEFLEQTLAPRWRDEAEAGERPKHIRAWSAGCSSGEEAYSLAMSLLTYFPAQSGWAVDVLGTDVSTRVLERARSGVWPIEKATEIPVGYRRRFMLRGTGERHRDMKAGTELRATVRFLPDNLNVETAAPVAYDLIFCRNVLIYFNAASKERVVRRLLAALAPQGLLFLGHAESLTGLQDPPHAVIPTVYRRAAG